MYLFVDDTREFPKSGFQCCRDYETAVLLLKALHFDSISLDYTLGSGKNGLDILIWMKENNISVAHINIHSNHIIGKEKMREYCELNFPDSEITTVMLAK